ncbi:MAG: acyl carrier protein [Puia sp.]|nr:acyl carrier protein [Puia sp.]
MADIATRVKGILIEKLGLEEAAITDQASFSNDLGVDSLDKIETFVELEKQFSIRIPDEDAEKLTTVGSLINYIIEHKN